MKSKLTTIVAILLLTTIALGAFDKTKPASTTSLRSSNPEILANWTALETAIDKDHEFTSGGDQDGEHDQVTLLEKADLGTGAAGVPILGAQTVAGKAELVFTDEDDNDIQLTSGGSMGSATTAFLANTATYAGLITANGGVTLGAGDDLTGSTTSGITIGTNVFTVADDDSGDTAIAGTLGVTGIATLGDSSTLATSAAPSADAEIANKKYVDDNETTIQGYAAGAVNTVTFPLTVSTTGASNTDISVAGGSVTVSGFLVCRMDADAAMDNSEFSISAVIGGTKRGGISLRRPNGPRFNAMCIPVTAGEAITVTMTRHQTSTDTHDRIYNWVSLQ